MFDCYITMCMTTNTCSCNNNHHFVHHECLSECQASLCFKLYSRLSFVSPHQQARRKVRGGLRGAHPRQRGEPKESSILIKGLGAEPQLKIETEGDWHRFLQALPARLTAAPQHQAVEPSRESARLPMMR